MKSDYVDPQNYLLEDSGFIDAISDYMSQSQGWTTGAAEQLAGAGSELARQSAHATSARRSAESNRRSLDDLYSELGSSSSEVKSNVRDSIGKSVNEEEASFLQNLLRRGLDVLPDGVRSSITDVGTDIVLDQASEEELERIIIDYASGLSSEELIRIATSHISDIGANEIQDMLRSFIVSMDKEQLVDLIQSAIDSGLITDDQILDIGLDYVV